MFFEKDFPDKLRSQILASEIVGKKVKLKGRGPEFSGLCPFHNEKTPSFSVNDQKGFYHCFGCGAHGDIVSFVMNVEGLEFKDAVEQIANDFGIAIPLVKNIDFVKEDKTVKTYELLEEIAKFFEKNLHSKIAQNARQYLSTRQINSTIAKKFRLGFAPDSYEELVTHLQKLGFKNDELLKSGVIGKNNQNNLFAKFRNRVIFPILDKKNRVIAFGGRTISDAMPKYLNSAETELFKKSQTLYNLSFARKAIFDKKYAIIVEGYMDAIALAKNSIENVVAGLGTALGKEHLQELFNITDKIVICLDGDLAGINASKRIAEIALPMINSKKNIEFNILPNQLDPDDFIKEFGVNETKKTFENSIPLSQMLFDFAIKEFGIILGKKNISAEKKAKVEAFLSDKIELIGDKSTKKYFSLYFKDILFQLGRNGNSKGLIRQTPKISLSKISDSKSEILALLIKFPYLVNFNNDKFDIREFEFGYEEFDEIKDKIVEAIEEEDILTLTENYAKITEKILLDLEKFGFNNHIAKIKNIIENLNNFDIDHISIRFQILLLRNLLIQITQEYKALTAENSEVANEKIAYCKSLEQEIASLEKELI